jgi:hypothetical protein
LVIIQTGTTPILTEKLHAFLEFFLKERMRANVQVIRTAKPPIFLPLESHEALWDLILVDLVSH